MAGVVDMIAVVLLRRR